MFRFCHIWACRRGVAATEFALVLPLMVLVLVGIAELGNALLLDRKITRAAHIGADFVTQEDTVTSASIGDVQDAMENILLPFPFGTDHRMCIASVFHDPDTTQTRVDWFFSFGNGPACGYSAGTAVPGLPPNLVAEGDSVILAEINYRYESLFADLILDTFTINDRAYLRPRGVPRVILE